MNERDLETQLLLRDSGELSPAECAELETALADHPEWRAKADELAALLHAGPASSEITVPDLPEMNRARILKAAPTRRGVLPRLLALAAVLVIALALAPHILPPSESHAPEKIVLQQVETETDASGLLTEDPVLASLEELDEELDTLADLDFGEDLLVMDANDWASELLTLEDSI